MKEQTRNLLVGLTVLVSLAGLAVMIILFYEVPELLAYLRRCIGDGEDETPDTVIQRLSSPDFLLVLDDLGAHSQT
ncbi:hypothetical protein LCGC14_2005680, partial [marine sediment metagenome]